MLLLYGDVDEFTGVGSYEPWAQNLKSISDNVHRTVKDGRPGEGGVRVSEGGWEGDRGTVVQCLDGGTHFWGGVAARRMLAAIDTFLDSTGTWCDDSHFGTSIPDPFLLHRLTR